MKRLISMLLVLVMCAGLFPAGSFAEEQITENGTIEAETAGAAENFTGFASAEESTEVLPAEPDKEPDHTETSETGEQPETGSVPATSDTAPDMDLISTSEQDSSALFNVEEAYEYYLALKADDEEKQEQKAEEYLASLPEEDRFVLLDYIDVMNELAAMEAEVAAAEAEIAAIEAELAEADAEPVKAEEVETETVFTEEDTNAKETGTEESAEKTIEESTEEAAAEVKTEENKEETPEAEEEIAEEKKETEENKEAAAEEKKEENTDETAEETEGENSEIKEPQSDDNQMSGETEASDSNQDAPESENETSEESKSSEDESKPAAESSDKNKPETIKISAEKERIVIGETLQLSAEILPEPQEEETAELPEISVDEGASYTEENTPAVDEHENESKNNAINAENTSDTIANSEESDAATQLPAGESTESQEAAEFIWSSTDESVLTVDETGLVTAVEKGVAVVSASCGEKSGSIELTVLTSDEVTVTMDAMAALSGDCGQNVHWSYDSASKTLTISGTGDMTDYYNNNAPWRDFIEEIKSVKVEKDVTSIGCFAFRDCCNLTDVNIQNSVTTIE